MSDQISDRVKWIEHKGHKIFFNDYSGLDEASYLAAIDESLRKISEIDPGTVILFLDDVTGTFTTSKIKAKFREIEHEMAKYKYVIAVVGVSGMMKIIARAFMWDMYFAKDREDAKEWLIKQAKKIEAKQPVG